ncbi:MAG: hypothetical protein OQL08_12330 [Gammaproteobacteria bacterium]|nr:hypothetical protein [Gammaproteobacteria bacterium]
MSQLPSSSITLSLSAQWVDDYCRDLARRTSSAEKRLAALDALNTFVGVAATPDEQATAAFTAIRATLMQHTEQARAELLQHSATQLAEALRQQQLARAATLFSALSRDAFWQLLERVETILGPQQTVQLAAWCKEWLAQMKELAAQHSPYPDAIDFKASGIDLAEYLMMSDINKFFHHLH